MSMRYWTTTIRIIYIKISSPDKPKPEVEVVQMQPLPSTGDYEFTHCPAYVPVATTSIHGNTNELAADETLSTQSSTAAQGD